MTLSNLPPDPAIQMFQTRIREELPEFGPSIGDPIPDAYGNHCLLDVPCPSSPGRCRLEVLFRGDCFQIAFSVAATGGAAEQVIIVDEDLSGSVAATIDFLRDIVTGRIVVDVLRYRFLWFRPYYRAFFRETSRRPPCCTVETLAWAAAPKIQDMG
jgi:hypothetical protein